MPEEPKIPWNEHDSIVEAKAQRVSHTLLSDYVFNIMYSVTIPPLESRIQIL